MKRKEMNGMKIRCGNKLRVMIWPVLVFCVLIFGYMAQEAGALEQPSVSSEVISPSITRQPASLLVNNGKTASFRVAASGSNLRYQWQYSTDNGKTWKDSTLTGCRTSVMEVQSISRRNGYLYRCIVSNSYGSAVSTTAKLTVLGVKPALRSQTRALTASSGVKVTFKVSAAGTGLSYRWQYSTDGGKSWKNSTMTGFSTASMKVPVIERRNGYLYRCIVKNGYGSVTSSAAKLTVSGVKPVIRTQTKAITSEKNLLAKCEVAAAGTGLSYRWQYSADGGKTWKDSTMKGHSSAVMRIPVIERRNGYQYRCVVRNSYGSVTSSPAKLTVAGVKPVIRSQAKAVTASPNTWVSFKVSAAGEGIAYRWQYSTDNGETWKDSTVKGANTAVMRISAAERRNGYLYRCVIRNIYGMVLSSPAMLTVSGVKPVVLTQPEPQRVECGEIMTMSVTARGGKLTYQWQYSFDRGKTWHDWAGVTKTTVRLKANFDLNRTYYRCVIKNAAGSVKTKAARLICVSDMGSANKPYGKTVVISLFTSDSISKWNLNRKADKNRYQKCLQELRKGISYLQKGAEKYGRKAEYVFDWSKDKNLAQMVRFDERLVTDSIDTYPLQSSYIRKYADPDEIMEKYNADNVVYVFFFNTDMSTHHIKSHVYPWANYMPKSDRVELANVYIGSCGERNIGMVTAHEILHAFGAPDLYYANDRIPQEYVDYLTRIDSQDIMFNNWGKAAFTDLDAYHVGLTDYAKDVSKWNLAKSDHYRDVA